MYVCNAMSHSLINIRVSIATQPEKILYWEKVRIEIGEEERNTNIPTTSNDCRHADLCKRKYAVKWALLLSGEYATFCTSITEKRGWMKSEREIFMRRNNDRQCDYNCFFILPFIHDMHLSLSSFCSRWVACVCVMWCGCGRTQRKLWWCEPV